MPSTLGPSFSRNLTTRPQALTGLGAFFVFGHNMTAISQLDIFNEMIGTTGRLPYLNEGDAGADPYFPQALAIVSRVSRRMQTRGWWFNTTYFDAVPGAIEFPCAILRIQGPDLDGLVIRGPGIYNMREKGDLSATVRNVKAVVELAFEDLPPIAQDWVLARAVLEFQGSYDSTNSTTARWERQVAESFVLMNTEDIKAKRANRLLSPSVLMNISRARGQTGQSGKVYY